MRQFAQPSCSADCDESILYQAARHDLGVIQQLWLSESRVVSWIQHTYPGVFKSWLEVGFRRLRHCIPSTIYFQHVHYTYAFFSNPKAASSNGVTDEARAPCSTPEAFVSTAGIVGKRSCVSCIIRVALNLYHAGGCGPPATQAQLQEAADLLSQLSHWSDGLELLLAHYQKFVRPPVSFATVLSTTIIHFSDMSNGFESITSAFFPFSMPSTFLQFVCNLVPVFDDRGLVF